MEYNAPDNTMLCRRHNDRAIDRAAIPAASSPRNMPINSPAITAQRSPTRSLKRILLSNNNYIIIMKGICERSLGVGGYDPCVILIIPNNNILEPKTLRSAPFCERYAQSFRVRKIINENINIYKSTVLDGP